MLERKTFTMNVAFGLVGLNFQQKTKNVVEVGGYGVANERIYLGKNVRCITRSEHKQYFNESYVE